MPMPTILPTTSWGAVAAEIRQLHDPARLLGHDARRHPHAVEDQGQELEHHEHDADDPAAAVLGRVDRAWPGRPPRPAACDASSTENVGMTNGRVAAGCDRVQSRMPTANAPTWSSCWRSCAERADGDHADVDAPPALRSTIAAPDARAVGDRRDGSGLGAGATSNRTSGRARPTCPAVEERVHGADRRVRRGPASSRRHHDAGHRRPVHERGRQRDQRDQHREAGEQQRREHERPRLRPARELAARDEPDVRAAARRPLGLGASAAASARDGRREVRSPRPTGCPTWSMNTCSSDGSAISKCSDARPGADRRREDARAPVRLELDRSSGPCPAGSPARRRTPASQAAGGPRRRRPDHPPAGRPPHVAHAARRPPSGPGRRSRPTRTAPRPSPSGGWRRRRVRPRSRSSRNASLSSTTLTGSRPVNGSSMSRTSGLVEDGGDELDLLLVALGELLGLAVREVLGDAEPARATRAPRAAPGPPARRGARRRRRAGPGPASAGRGRAPRAGSPTSARGSRWLAVPLPGDRPASGSQDAQRDAHRRRLAGPVRAEEAEDLAGRHLEREVVEGDDAPEPLDEVVDDEAHPAGA